MVRLPSSVTLKVPAPGATSVVAVRQNSALVTVSSPPTEATRTVSMPPEPEARSSATTVVTVPPVPPVPVRMTRSPRATLRLASASVGEMP